MKCLITGGAGFLGSHIARELIEKGHDVVIVDDLSGGFIRNVPNKARFYQLSITDDELLELMFKTYKFDYVFHLAAYAAEGLSHFIRHYNYTNNVLGSINVINACIKYKVKKLIFTSSMGVYGTQPTPYLEDQKPQPEDPYGIAKYSIEQDLKAAHEMFGLNYIIFRPHNIYGTNQNIHDRYRNVIGIFMNQIMSDKPITVFGDGDQIRAFSYVGDMAPIMADSINRDDMNQEIFNIGGDKPYTINELAQQVMKAMGKEVEIKHLAERYEVKNAFSTHDKIRKYVELGQTPLEDGLKVMAKWAKLIGPGQVSDMPLELKDNLYEAWK